MTIELKLKLKQKQKQKLVSYSILVMISQMANGFFFLQEKWPMVIACIKTLLFTSFFNNFSTKQSLHFFSGPKREISTLIRDPFHNYYALDPYFTINNKKTCEEN